METICGRFQVRSRPGAWLGWLAVAGGCLVGGTPLAAADSAQFGSAWTRNMVSAERGLPASFDPATGAQVAWSVPLGTETHSTPVVAGGRIYIGTNNEEPRDPRRTGDRGVLLCLDERDGRLLWQLAVPKREEDPYLDWPKSGLSSTATVEGDRVYVVDNRGVVLCLDAAGLTNGNQGPFGEEAAYLTPRGTNAVSAGVPLQPPDADILWSLDLTRELGIWSHDAAHSSILIHGNHLYLNSGTGVDNTHKVIRTPDAPSLVVLDKRTGAVLATDGLGIAPRIFHCTWSSPSLARLDGRETLVFAGGDGVVYGFEPLPPDFAAPTSGAKPATLRKLWQFDFDPDGPKTEVHRYNGNRAVSPSNIYGMPVLEGGRMYVAGGGDWFWGKNEAWLKCVEPAGEGDLTVRGRRWTYPVHRHSMSTPAVKDGLVYVADSMRVLHCVDAATGAGVWTQELGGEVWASPLVADGRVYLGTRRGDFWILSAGREKRVFSTVQLDGPISATAVAANGTLYVATMKRLHALRGDATAGPGRER